MIEFGSTNVADEIAAMEREDAKGSFTSNYWSPKKEGISKIRFLPKLKSFGEEIFYQKVRQHWVNNRSFFCLNQTLKDKNGNIHQAEECPFCKKSKQLYNIATRDSAEWKTAGDLRARDRYISRIIVRGNTNDKGEDIEWKPVFFEFGQKIREIIMSAFRSGDYGNPIDIKAGRDFNLQKKGVKRSTDYSGSMFAGSTSMIFEDSSKLKALLNELQNMDYSQLIEFRTSEELQNELREFLSDGSEEEVYQKPAPRKAQDSLEEAIYGGTPKAEAPASEEEDIDALLNSI